MEVQNHSIDPVRINTINEKHNSNRSQCMNTTSVSYTMESTPPPNYTLDNQEPIQFAKVNPDDMHLKMHPTTLSNNLNRPTITLQTGSEESSGDSTTSSVESPPYSPSNSSLANNHPLSSKFDNQHEQRKSAQGNSVCNTTMSIEYDSMKLETNVPRDFSSDYQDCILENEILSEPLLEHQDGSEGGGMNMISNVTSMEVLDSQQNMSQYKKTDIPNLISTFTALKSPRSSETSPETHMKAFLHAHSSQYTTNESDTTFQLNTESTKIDIQRTTETSTNGDFATLRSPHRKNLRKVTSDTTGMDTDDTSYCFMSPRNTNSLPPSVPLTCTNRQRMEKNATFDFSSPPNNDSIKTKAVRFSQQTNMEFSKDGEEDELPTPRKHINLSDTRRNPSIKRRRSGGQQPFKIDIPQVQLKESEDCSSKSPGMAKSKNSSRRPPPLTIQPVFNATFPDYDDRLLTSEKEKESIHIDPRFSTTPRARKNENLKLELSTIDKNSSGKKFQVSNEQSRKRQDLEYSGILTQVEPYLYIGSLQGAQDEVQRKSLGITALMDCAKTSKLRQSHFTHTQKLLEEIREGNSSMEYCSLGLHDRSGQDASSFFYNVVEIIESVRNRGGAILVHCVKGISRSAAIVLAYLMWKYKWNFEQSMEFLKAKRPTVNPNAGFVFQLYSWAVNRPSIVINRALVYRIELSTLPALVNGRPADYSTDDLLNSPSASEGWNNISKRMPLAIGPLHNIGSTEVNTKSNTCLLICPACSKQVNVQYIWYNSKLCDDRYVAAAQSVASQLEKFENAPSKTILVDVGEETQLFWEILAGAASKDNTVSPKILYNAQNCFVNN